MRTSSPSTASSVPPYWSRRRCRPRRCPGESARRNRSDDPGPRPGPLPAAASLGGVGDDRDRWRSFPRLRPGGRRCGPRGADTLCWLASPSALALGATMPTLQQSPQPSAEPSGPPGPSTSVTGTQRRDRAARRSRCDGATRASVEVGHGRPAGRRHLGQVRSHTAARRGPTRRARTAPRPVVHPRRRGHPRLR